MFISSINGRFRLSLWMGTVWNRFFFLIFFFLLRFTLLFRRLRVRRERIIDFLNSVFEKSSKFTHGFFCLFPYWFLFFLNGFRFILWLLLLRLTIIVLLLFSALLSTFDAFFNSFVLLDHEVLLFFFVHLLSKHLLDKLFASPFFFFFT